MPLEGPLESYTDEWGETQYKPLSANPPKLIESLNEVAGPLSALDLNPFLHKKIEYPLNVEEDVRYGNYIRFDILMAVRSKYAAELSFGNNDKLQEMHTANDGASISLDSKKGVAIRNIFQGNKDTHESSAVEPTAVSALFKRQVTKTEQTISIYMPDTLNWTFAQEWKSEEMSEVLGKSGQALAALKIGADAVKRMINNENATSVGEELTKPQMQGALGEGLGMLLGNSKIGVAMTGLAINPSVEVFYQKPALREFQFDFTFAPRNQEEAKAMLQIIQLFKFHSAPELLGGDLGRYYVPPSEFDITFMGRNGRLWQLGKILPQSVLVSVNVNYAPSTFSVFEDGTPTNIGMQLRFKETAFLTKEVILDDEK